MPRIDNFECLALPGDFTPSSVQTVAFSNPGVAGLGAIIGPVRQRVVSAQSYHGVASAQDGITLQRDLVDLVGTFIGVDPDGTVFDNVFVQSCVPHRPKGVAGLLNGNTHLVIADWELILSLNGFGS